MLDRTKISTPHSPTGNPAAGNPVTVPSEAEAPGAILVLDSPPTSWTPADWYLMEIAGVPFLLRNILAIQRGGVERLIIFHHERDGEDLGALSQLFGDSRINLKIDLISDPIHFADILKSGRHRLLLNGSALHRREDVAVSLKSGLSSSAPREGTYPIPVEKLENLIISNQLRISELEQVIIKGYLRDTDTETGIFLAGGKESFVLSEGDFQVQDERLFQSCGLSNDSFMDRLITRRVSRQLTRFFVRTPLTPNQITGLSLILGLGAACLFFPGSYFAGMCGAGLLMLSAWIDCTDGEVARLKFQESSLGSALDIFSDNIVHFAVFFSIGMGLYFSTGKSIYKTLGILAVLGSAVSFALIYSKIVQGKSKASESGTDAAAGAENQKGIDLAAHIANRDFIYLIFILAVADQLRIFIIITAIGANVFAAFLAYTRLKPYIMPAENLCSNNSEKG